MPKWGRTPAMEHRIKEIMTEKGISIEKLSAAVGSTPNYLNKLLGPNKSRRLNDEMIDDIARALDVEVYELFAPKEMVMGKLPVFGVVPAGNPQTLEEPHNIEKYISAKVNNSKCYAKQIKAGSRSMDNKVLPGHFIWVDPTVTDPDTLNGKYVLAYYQGDCTFKKFVRNPDRLVPDSTDPEFSIITITEYSDFRILGWVYGTSSEL